MDDGVIFFVLPGLLVLFLYGPIIGEVVAVGEEKSENCRTIWGMLLVSLLFLALAGLIMVAVVALWPLAILVGILIVCAS